MTARPTTTVESDQLARAAMEILRNEDFVPKGKRWPFSRHSKAHRDYEKAVQEITERRRISRARSAEERLRAERAEADTAFERAKATANAEHDEKLAEVKKPFEETEARARRERDAAIAAANAAYQEALEKTNRTYQEATALLDEKRDALVNEAKAARDAAYAEVESKQKDELARIARELKTIPLEGPMRIVEDRHAWSIEERKRALMGIVDMAGREDFDAELTNLCLHNVANYVFQDRFLSPDAQHHRLMDAQLLERIVELARRCPEKRPTIVRYMHQIVTQNFGHSSTAFIRSVTELYVIASSDTETVYAKDPAENERIFETMREQIADTLKLTPRRSQVPPPAADTAAGGEQAAAPKTDAAQAAKVATVRKDGEITAEVDARELVAVEASEAVAAKNEAQVVAKPSTPPSSSASRPPPIPRLRGKRAPSPESS